MELITPMAPRRAQTPQFGVYASQRVETLRRAVVSQFEVEAALRRHLARQTRRYEFKLRQHYPPSPRADPGGICRTIQHPSWNSAGLGTGPLGARPAG